MIGAIQETRWQGNGVYKSGEYVVMKSGGNGVVNGTGYFFNLTILCVYAPTEEANNEEKEAFYAKLEEEYCKIQQWMTKIIMGDLNAKNKRNKGFNPRTVFMKSKEGQLVGDDQEMLKMWREHFQTLLNGEFLEEEDNAEERKEKRDKDGKTMKRVNNKNKTLGNPLRKQ
ncbi:hypothetical protein J437_LFUL004814 [Ladona fulva]|uniref:Endonuclease/exonuclease/phosphatase domain-containing protein n=1 Tax=Ladona fulva TaxID=123851 RepID=A0A8K0K260_LADFU|nr:hypothetical protein J437_LFUL004814 [Ladona fulva]